MAHCSSTITCLPFARRFCAGALSHEPRSWRASRQPQAFIHVLDDDSLLNIFHNCRLAGFDEGGFDDFPTLQISRWEGERWWYKLVKVCRRWRHLILGSAYHLRAGLLCTRGTPVADMLALGPPVPLIIDYLSDHIITFKEKEDIILALQHRDRVRCIRIQIHIPDLEMLILNIDEEFPMLEYLAITAVPSIMYNTSLMLPETFQAPRLRHLMLTNVAFCRS